MTDSGLFSGLHWTEGLSPRECTVTEIAELVESTKWAHKLSGKEVTTLSRYLCVCEAEKGAVIVREGGREAYLCLLIRGQVSIMKEAAKSETETDRLRKRREHVRRNVPD